MDIRLRTAIAPSAYPFWFAWRLCVDTVGAGCTGVGVNKLGPPGLMLFAVEDTGGVVVVVVVVVLVVVLVVVVVVVVEGFSSPLPPHAAVSPPIAIRALVPATAARQRTLRDLILFPIYARPAPFCGGLARLCSVEIRRSTLSLTFARYRRIETSRADSAI